MSDVLNEADVDRMAEQVQLALMGAIPKRIETMTVSEWAEQKRILPRGLTSRPGPFRWDGSPYLREIADCLSESSDVREIALMKGAQVGGTVAIIENFIGYTIDVCPGPMLAITGDKGMADQWMEKRIDPLIQGADIQGKIFAQVQKQHGKKTGDTKDAKEFPGGFLIATGPNAAAKLRANAIQKLILDEEDAYPQELGDEGDMVTLAIRRTDTFEGSRKILHISTPLLKGVSRIEAAFLQGDQRRYFVPCKHCGEMQTLDWKHLTWKTDSAGLLDWDSVRYICDKCGDQWSNSDKAWFLPAGEWRAMATPKKKHARSYHLSSLYAPPGTRSWESIVEEWIAAKDDLGRLRVFTNTVLGETWEERGEAPRWEKIMSRLRGNYRAGKLPENHTALVVTLGADVQKDRIEAEIVAWGEGFRSWSIAYLVFEGRTDTLDSPAWKGLAKAIEGKHAGFDISLALIDCGYNTNQVYEFCEAYTNGVMPVMSDPQVLANPEGRAQYSIKQVVGFATQRVGIQSGRFKRDLYGSLGRDAIDGEVPRGYCQFPEDYPEEYFKQLTAESLHVEKMRSGATRYVWKQSRPRNEALDARIYATAALFVFAGQLRDDIDPEQSIEWEAIWTLLKRLRA